MKYVEVCIAQYDYEARTPDEITVHEDDTLYIIEKEDDDWWRAELKQPNGEQGPIGLIPANYMVEVEPLGKVRAEYEYEAQHDEELSFGEGQEMLILERDDPDWLLVKLIPSGDIGLAPSNYVQEEQLQQLQQQEHQPPPVAAPVPVLPSSASVASPATPSFATPPSPATPQQPVAPQPTGSRPPVNVDDEAQTWTMHEYDPAKKKKKKGKGSLLVGNGMICYGSDTDKASPVRQYPILDVTKYLFDGKNLHIEISGERPAVLDLQASSKSEAKAILVKITDSRTLAQHAATHVKAAPPPLASTPSAPLPASSVTPSVDDETYSRATTPARSLDSHAPAMPPRPTATPPAPVAATPPPPPLSSSMDPKWAIILYTFAAEGGEELSVNENEQVLVMDYERTDGWYRIETTDGRQGLVPSSYVEFHDDVDNDAGARHDHALAAAEEEQRAREEEQRAREEEERRFRQQQQEEEDRRRRQREEEARQREARRREEEEREAERRRKLQEAAQSAEMARQRQLAADEARRSQQAAQQRNTSLQRTATLPSRAPDATSSSSGGLSRSQSVSSRSDLPKPDMSQVRTWTDRSGAFKVQAQFLSLYEGKFRLHKTNGVKIDVPVDKMSPEDIQWVEAKLGKSISSGSPMADIAAGQKTPEMPPRPQPATSPATAAPAAASAASSSSARASKEAKKTNPNWDWFDWFMMIGIPMEAALRYAPAFKGDKLDDSDLENLTHRRMKMLGVKENHVRRIERYLETQKPEPPSDDENEQAEEEEQPVFKSKAKAKAKAQTQAEIDRDEEYARKLYRDWNGEEPAKPSTARPKPSKSAPKDIHPDLLEFVGTQFTGDVGTKPKPEHTGKADLMGFDDDAWTPRSEPKEQPVLQPKPAPAPAQPQQQQTTGASTPVQQMPVQQQQLPQQAPVQQTYVTGPQEQQQQQPPIQPIQQAYTGGAPQQQVPIQQAYTGGTPEQAPVQQAYATGPAPVQQPYLTGGQTMAPMQQPYTTGPAVQQQQQQQQQGMPPRERPVSMLKYTADPTLSRWQQSPSSQPAQPVQQQPIQQAPVQQQPIQQQQPMQPTYSGGMMMQSPPLQQQFQVQPAQWSMPMQPAMTGYQQQQPPFTMAQQQQPMYTSSYQQPVSSVLHQPLAPAPSQALNQNRASMMGISTQPTGRHWQTATPQNPFGSPADLMAPISPQQTGPVGAQFSTPNADMFKQSPVQHQPTGMLQPQMTGLQPQMTGQPSVFTRAGSMAHGQSGFHSQYGRGW